MGKLVGLAYDEVIEGVSLVQRCRVSIAGGRRRHRRGRGARRAIGRPAGRPVGTVGVGVRIRRIRGFDREAHLHLLAYHAFQRLGDERVHTLFQHLGYESVRDAYDELAGRARQAGGVFEPGLVVLPLDLHLEIAERGFPKLARVGIGSGGHGSVLVAS